MEESRRARIEQELTQAQAALQEGNDGMARVCARRAVGLAVEDWLERAGTLGWRRDSMGQLTRIQGDASFPRNVRQAAERLTATIARRHIAPVSADPLTDARTIIAHLSSREV